MPQQLPPPKFRAVDDDGNPLVGGKVFTYTAGTTTPKDSYTSFTLGAANTNPVILDSRGEASIWLDGAYKIRLRDADDNLIWEVDNVRDLTSSQTFASPTISGTPVFTGTSVTWSGNPTHSGNHTYTGNVTVNGNTSIGNASTDTLTIAPNAVTWSNNPTHSGNHTFSGSVTFTGTSTLNPPTGSFTPGVTFGGGSTGVTYDLNRRGRYTRVGDVVHFWLRLALSSKGSSTGAVQITGLPVTPSSSSAVPQIPFAVSADAGALSGLTGAPYAQAASGSTALSIYQWGATGGAALTDTNFTNTTDIYISGSYKV